MQANPIGGAAASSGQGDARAPSGLTEEIGPDRFYGAVDLAVGARAASAAA
jgi:hypothetical protein